LGLTNGRKSIGTDVATSEPAEIGAVLVGTELLLGVNGALAATRRGEQRRWGAGQLGQGIGRLLTSLTQGFMEEAGKGFGFLGAFTPRGNRCDRRRAKGGALGGPQHMKYQVQPHQGEQQEFVKQQVRDHKCLLSHEGGRRPSYLIS
jgi:hypothetical protein